MFKTAASLALVLATQFTNLNAQDRQLLPDSNKTGPRRRWSLVVGGLAHSPGPADELERAMVAAGLDDDYECTMFCIGSIPHPESKHGPLGVGMALSYKHTDILGVRLSWSMLELCETDGYRDPFMSIDVKARVQTVSAIAFASPAGVFRIGAGPSINFLRAQQRGELDSRKTSTGDTRVGLTLDIGLSAPDRTRYFLDIGAQYRFVGSGQVGPFHKTSPDGLTTTTFETRASYNHGVISFGLGMRW